MNKSYTNQKGFGMIMIVIIVAAVLALGAVGWFVLAREDSDESSSSTEATSEEAETADNASFSGSYFDALERGEALQCQWRVPEDLAGEYQVGEGQFYTDGESRGYTEATFETDGVSTTAYAIFDSEYVYSWFNLPGVGTTGTKFPMTQLESDYNEMSETEQQQAIDIRADYSFDCEPWTVDESILTPPTDVTFTEITP